ncbi:Bug family tripartite tricarboxylate transporter substrate binding protein [Bordetella genomosp. 9]|uniref:ABC transporter substrate-binding protein n=1 Tax=Bordetella genomosp. 9 TaxID=1416803 RepID=A0A1W6Z026_9BORD|nr:tripartite tricarboxylate transporter substrate binding protein [Bordetella genomosp. 9]ARP86678.1 ABC transporter substrate-binding protein [Bordetella genomosp. 9]ARP90671.1 ABC transporter substrate-binding protein [Bordetella genomosp. 9]
MAATRHLWVAGAVLLGAWHPAQAAFPDHPITIVVPAAPGGTTDISARLLAEKMSASLKQTIVVENRAGAAGIVGSQAVARAKPDGYTLVMGNIGPNAINYSLYKTLPYQPQDFAPITLVISVPNVLEVNSAQTPKTAAELIALLKRDPAARTFGSSGAGQSPHMSAELFKQRVGVEATHVPYKGAGPAVAALLANQFTFMIDNLPSSLPSIKAGKLRALAVTGEKRSPQLPDVPTMKEAGIDNMVVTAWFGLLAPAGTPAPVIDKLYQAARDGLQSPDIIAKFRDMGGEPGGNTPAEFGAFIDRERAMWEQTVKGAGMYKEQ